MNHWDAAVKDLTAFNKAYAQVERKPSDPTALKKCLTAVSKALNLVAWARIAFPGYCLMLAEAQSDARSLLKSKFATLDEFRTVIDFFRTSTQDTLDAIAPAVFTYNGFKVVNPHRLGDEPCRKTLQGIDVLITLFKKRGVSKAVLDNAISRVILDDVIVGMTAAYSEESRELALSVARLSTDAPGRFIDSHAGEAVIHEIGHSIYFASITRNARVVWNAPWRGIPSLRTWEVRLLNDTAKNRRAAKLSKLGIPTSYGKNGVEEDFAETFLLFIVDPQRLSPTAAFRMQRALALSGLYGKPVMPLA